jgi:uncharacterized protein with PQ loop repeat
MFLDNSALIRVLLDREYSTIIDMAGNSTVSNIFGTLGAVCWSVQLIPQIVLNYRRHSAAGLSSGFMLFWASAGIPLGVYNIVSRFNIALQIQPQILASLSLITWGQCYLYDKKWSLWKVLAAVLPLALVMGGVEVALVFATQIAIDREINWPLTLMAVLAAVLLGLGVMEQYLAIWKNRSVEGISFLFCGIDALGDLTSIVSVVFEAQINILGIVMYGVEFILWCGIFACGFWFKWIPWLRTKLETARRATRRETPARSLPDTPTPLHDMPSSTSVFRVAAGNLELRERLGQGTQNHPAPCRTSVDDV